MLKKILLFQILNLYPKLVILIVKVMNKEKMIKKILKGNIIIIINLLKIIKKNMKKILKSMKIKLLI